MKKRTVCFLLLFFIAVTAVPSRLDALDVGDTAKDFALTGVTGTIVTLSESTQGARATVLEFLSVYCEACQKKVSYLNQLAEKYGPQGLRIIAVALANDQQETDGLIKEWSITYPVLPDPEKKTFYLYGIHKVPQFFVIDESNIIRYRGNADNTQDIEKNIETLLKKEGATSLKPGDLAPRISLPSVKGGAVDIAFNEEVANTILVFFSATDGASRELAQTLCTLAQQNSAGVRIYGIVPAAAKKKAGELTADCSAFPLLVDTEGEAFEKFGVSRAPEVIILSRSGYVRQRNAPQTLSGLTDLLKPTAAAASTVDEKHLMEFLRQALPGATSIRPVRISDTDTMYVGDTARGKRLYARVVKKDILCEVCTDLFYILAFDESGTYRNIVLLKPFELYGKPIDAGPFVRQFIGTSYHQKFAAGSTADTISGATKSCTKFIEGLNETEKVFSELQKPPYDASFKKAICFLNQTEIEAALQKYQHGHVHQKQDVAPGDLAAYCPGGRLPQCPEGGTYRITIFNSIPRALCTVHGLDPQASMIY